MQYTLIIMSAITAFIIGAGGVIMGVAGSGYELNNKSWVISAVVGAMAASKDWRSQMKMPPVPQDALDTTTITKISTETTKTPSVVQSVDKQTKP